VPGRSGRTRKRADLVALADFNAPTTQAALPEMLRGK